MDVQKINKMRCEVVKIVNLPEIISEPIHRSGNTLFDIAEIVTNVMNVKMSDLFSHSRKGEYVNARMIFFYYVKENTKLTYKEIGSFLKKDRGTVRYHHKKLTSWMEMKYYRKYYVNILQKINNQL